MLKQERYDRHVGMQGMGSGCAATPMVRYQQVELNSLIRAANLLRLVLAVLLATSGCIPAASGRRPLLLAPSLPRPDVPVPVHDYAVGLAGAGAEVLPPGQLEPTSLPEEPLLPSRPEAARLRPIRLHEAIRMALQNNEVLVRASGGTAAVENGPNLGFGTLGRTIYDPALFETEIERQLARFDARWETSLFWDSIDVPFGSVASQFQGFRRDIFQGQTVLRKPLITGGEVSIGFNTNYQFRRVITPLLQGLINPEYETQLVFAIRHPLGGPDAGGRFGGAGVEYNRVPIMIARINADQELWQFKENLMIMVRDVEEAYWNLYGSQVQYQTLLRAVEQSWRYVRDLEEANRVGKADPAELLEARAQLDDLREALLQAKAGRRGAAGLPFDGLLVAEARLRALIGLPPHDGTRLVAVDEPTIAPVELDWDAVIRDAYRYRPQLALHRLNVLEQRQRWIRARGQLRPQIDVGAQFQINGLDSTFDGSLDVLTDGNFNDYQFDIQITVPLGYRRELADAQTALLQIAAAKARLYQAMRETDHTIAELYREVDLARERYLIARDQLRTAQDRLKVNVAQWEAGQQDRSVVNLRLVQAIEGLRRAQLAELEARVNYNIALVRLEHAKGTLLSYDNIHFHPGPWAVRVEMVTPTETEQTPSGPDQPASIPQPPDASQPAEPAAAHSAPSETPSDRAANAEGRLGQSESVTVGERDRPSGPGPVVGANGWHASASEIGEQPVAPPALPSAPERSISPEPQLLELPSAEPD